MRIRELTERIRHSLWFVPTLSVIVAAVVSLGAVGLSDRLDRVGADLPLIFGAGPDGARAMLQAIAGSVITVAGVTFSITIVALQLTSTQFSPRVLRNFLRDRPNQLVLGVFMGTFTYCLLVLRSIRGADELGEAFVPNLAITGALVLAFVSLGMLIFFIHHISVRLQVTSIVASVADDTMRTIRHLSEWTTPRPDRGWLPAGAGDGTPAPPSGAIPPSGDSVMRATESGYLQLVDLGGLVRDAERAGGTYRLLVAPGAWVQRDAPVATFHGRTEAPIAQAEHRDRIADALAVADERSTQQDVAFGIQQLVDIAVKALSPSVNDPTTAIGCIDRLVEVLVAAGTSADPPRWFADLGGTRRLEVPYPGFDELIQLAFDAIRHYGATTPTIATHLARALSVLRDTLPASRLPYLRAQATALAESVADIARESDRARVMEAVGPLLG